MQSNPLYIKLTCSRARLSLQTCFYDSNSGMSFEEPTNPKSGEQQSVKGGEEGRKREREEEKRKMKKRKGEI